MWVNLPGSSSPHLSTFSQLGIGFLFEGWGVLPGDRKFSQLDGMFFLTVLPQTSVLNNQDGDRVSGFGRLCLSVWLGIT